MKINDSKELRAFIASIRAKAFEDVINIIESSKVMKPDGKIEILAPHLVEMIEDIDRASKVPIINPKDAQRLTKVERAYGTGDGIFHWHDGTKTFVRNEFIPHLPHPLTSLQAIIKSKLPIVKFGELLEDPQNWKPSSDLADKPNSEWP